MIKILTIAWKDMRSTARNVPALVMMLIAPLALAGLLGFAFGGGSNFSIAATKIAVANMDTAPAAGAGSSSPTHAVGDELVGVLTSPGLKDVLAVTKVGDAAAARKRVDDGKAANAVIIPAGFSAARLGSQGQRDQVELYDNPTQALGNAITAAVVGRTLQDFSAAGAAAAAADAVAAAAVAPPASRGPIAVDAAQRFLAGGGVDKALAVTEREPIVAGSSESKNVGTSGRILAGMMIFFLFFGASNVARTILTEDRDGTLPRMLTTPTTAGTILGGKFASVFLTVTAQAAVLLVAGRLLFGIDWGGLGGVVALTLAGAGAASGLALLIISAVRTPGQAGAIGAGVYLILALLGGNFTGTATVGTTYASLQKLTPNGWLLRGWDALMRGGSLTDVPGALLVPLGFAVVFFAVAALRFRRRYA